MPGDRGVEPDLGLVQAEAVLAELGWVGRASWAVLVSRLAAIPPACRRARWDDMLVGDIRGARRSWGWSRSYLEGCARVCSGLRGVGPMPW